ncbi:hypothetical protein [Hymenobacter sp. BT190]|uniref:hypothetical protein n=1 Tax=Hymenobacter sp. BT190 TaxID=2763505 RepID=UPI0016515042|nr:hypothetical protein [Hymenobacter sp. BT190]MBC6697722.1 hypothetical protein [Hymenobacter sp. BT190]
MRVFMLILSATLLLNGCESKTRTLRYYAFEDLVVGSYTVNLFTNGECEVEMGAGYHDGRYTIQGDTLRITYQEGPVQGLPSRFLITPNYLLTLPTAEYPESTKIHGSGLKKGQ